MKPYNCGATDAFFKTRQLERNYNERSAWAILERQYKDTLCNQAGGTQFFWNLILEKYLRGTAGSFPASLYVGLSSTLPTNAPTSNWNVTEPTGGGYQRQLITVGTAAFPALSLGSTSNAAPVNWGNATATLLGGVNLIDWVIYDALTGGNLHIWADLTNPQPVFNGNPYSLAIGRMIIGGI